MEKSESSQDACLVTKSVWSQSSWLPKNWREKGRYASLWEDLAGVEKTRGQQSNTPEKVGGRQVQTTGMRPWKEGLLLN